MEASTLAQRYSNRINWEQIDLSVVRRLIEKARAEDLSGFGLRIAPNTSGDLTSSLIQNHYSGEAKLVAREPMVVCGLPLIPLILESYQSKAQFSPLKTDGDFLEKGCAIGSLIGSSQQILEAERILLNFLQKLSGIASLTHRYVSALGDSPTRLLDTRKTTPGLRVLEKYAVSQGGGWNHRFGLFDRIMIKDNHLAAANATGGRELRDFVASAKQRYPQVAIQVEVDRLDQIEPAIQGGTHIILLDNFSQSELLEAIHIIENRAASEASGGITLETISNIANIGLDFISTGATIHQSTWIDIGLDWNLE